MNEAKMSRILESFNGIARKVLNAVPIEEAWTAVQIAAEMRRTTGANPDVQVVQGCLARAVESGLVREPERGRFQQVKIRHAAPAAPKEPPPVSQKPKVVTMPAPREQPLAEQACAPLDRLGSIASMLRAKAEELEELADAIEAAALDADDRLQRVSEDSTKLRQLQAILKGLA